MKRNDKKSKICVYRSTEHQMQRDRQERNGRPASPLPSVAYGRHDSVKNNDTKPNDNCGGLTFLKVRGLPWSVNESYVVDLFPGDYKTSTEQFSNFHELVFLIPSIFLLTQSGLRIDNSNGVQMERDDKGRFNGTAILAFKYVEDFEIAIKTDLSSISK